MRRNTKESEKISLISKNNISVEVEEKNRASDGNIHFYVLHGCTCISSCHGQLVD